jgi:hypothetical protein
MTTTARPSPRGPVTRRPLLLLLVGALVAGLVATLLQVRPPSSAAEASEVAPSSAAEVAAEAKDVTISHGQPEVALKFGTEDTCVVTSRTRISGEADRVAEVIEATSASAREAGYTVTTYPLSSAAGAVLILSQVFSLSELGVGPASCSTAQVIDEHRGRDMLEVPRWARGMLAAAAAIAIYLVVVFATTTLFTWLAPEFLIYGEMLGGCVGGFASTYVANLINEVPQDANLTQSAVQCIAGAILNVTLGAVKGRLITELEAWLGRTKVVEAVTEACENVSARISSRVSSELGQSFSRLSQEIKRLD